MPPSPPDTGHSGARAALYLHPPGIAAAALLALPVGALAWFELLYLWFGFTGADASALFAGATALLAFGGAFAWPLYGAHRPAAVVRRSCRLGVAVALLLPVVAYGVLRLWEQLPGRRDLGMGGLMLYALPFVALAAALVFSAAFWAVGRVAARRLQAGRAP